MSPAAATASVSTDETLPKQQLAAVKEGSGSESRARVRSIEVPQPGPGQLLVRISWTGLCASDKSLLHDEWAAMGVSMQPEVTGGIAGHEGVGRVVALGAGVAETGQWQIGDRAGIKWIVDVCGTCHFCKQTDQGGEVLCTKQINSGFTAAGTFQEYCLTWARYATHIPDAVSDEEAGPVLCGGVTAYNACKRSAVRPGQWLVVPGAGGGVGHLVVQYARAMGMRVIAVDGGEAKRSLCHKLGAEHYLDFTASTAPDYLASQVRQLTGGLGAHGVVVTAASKASYATAPAFLRSGGTLVAVGLPADPTVIAGAPPLMVALKKLSIVGSVVGTLQDVDEALDFTARGLVRPILTKGTLNDVDKFIAEMKAGTLVGRAVLKVSG